MNALLVGAVCFVLPFVIVMVLDSVKKRRKQNEFVRRIRTVTCGNMYRVDRQCILYSESSSDCSNERDRCGRCKCTIELAKEGEMLLVVVTSDKPGRQIMVVTSTAYVGWLYIDNIIHRCTLVQGSGITC